MLVIWGTYTVEKLQCQFAHIMAVYLSKIFSAIVNNSLQYDSHIIPITSYN